MPHTGSVSNPYGIVFYIVSVVVIGWTIASSRRTATSLPGELPRMVPDEQKIYHQNEEVSESDGKVYHILSR